MSSLLWVELTLRFNGSSVSLNRLTKVNRRRQPVGSRLDYSVLLQNEYYHVYFGCFVGFIIHTRG